MTEEGIVLSISSVCAKAMRSIEQRTFQVPQHVTHTDDAVVLLHQLHELCTSSFGRRQRCDRFLNEHRLCARESLQERLVQIRAGLHRAP